jgi:hypothetical protein
VLIRREIAAFAAMRQRRDASTSPLSHLDRGTVSRRLVATTNTEDSAIAAPAIIGLSGPG